MRVKTLVQDNFQIVGVMEGDACPADDFLNHGEAATLKARVGLLEMLTHLAELGFHGVPGKWSHEADKQLQVYEFIKGDLRLFYFKGEGQQIAVCTGGSMKKGRKADKAAVAACTQARADYFNAVRAKTLQVIEP